MKIIFLKDHLGHKEGDVVTDHPNGEYLVKMGVAEEAKEKVEKTNHQKEKVDMVKPTTKKKN